MLAPVNCYFCLFFFSMLSTCRSSNRAGFCSHKKRFRLMHVHELITLWKPYIDIAVCSTLSQIFQPLTPITESYCDMLLKMTASKYYYINSLPWQCVLYLVILVVAVNLKKKLIIFLSLACSGAAPPHTTFICRGQFLYSASHSWDPQINSILWGN